MANSDAETRALKRDLGNLAGAVMDIADALKDLSENERVAFAQQTARTIASRNR
jgi:hypothetical protein